MCTKEITSKDVTWPRADTAIIGNIMRIGNITEIENVTEFDSNLGWKVTGIVQQWKLVSNWNGGRGNWNEALGILGEKFRRKATIKSQDDGRQQTKSLF